MAAPGDDNKNNQEPTQGLFGILSHELKSPINAIESLLKVVADGFTGETNQKTIQLIARALVKTGEARFLINDLFNFEKYSTSTIEKREGELTEIIAALFYRHKANASEKNISFSLQTPPGTKIIFEGDRAGLEVAIGNLFDNAIKYTGESGKITVALSCDQEKKTTTVKISDTGTGIPAQDLPLLFTPFFRSSIHRSRATGSGLGLSIAQRVIQQHGGTIDVESVINRGTAFSVRLPYVKLEHTEVTDKKRIVIIGGVTAGPKAAARLRRLDEDCEITIIEKSEFLSYAGCGIPAYLSGKVNSPRALMSTADSTLRDVHFFEHIKNIKVLNKTLAQEIDRKKKEVRIRDLASGAVSRIPYDFLILSTGAQSVVPPIPGIDGEGVHSLYKIEDAERIKELFSRRTATDVFIIGGGLIGIETAESLMASGARVTILEKDANILKLFDPEISNKLEEILNLKGIKIYTNINITEIIHENGHSKIITDGGEFSSDLIILSTGVKPDVLLAARAGLTIGPGGGITVDEFLRTNDPAISAIGDCAETKNLVSDKCGYLPLGSISTKMGRIVADNICGKKKKFKGGIGTTMFRIFETAVGRTGLGQEEAKNAGFDPVSVIVGGLDHTHYYKGAENIILKVIADRNSRRLLGAQGYGSGELVSRIEILACAITHESTLSDVFSLDLGYFPAFNNPIDILQTACVVLENKIEGILKTITRSEFLAARNSYTVIDLSPISDFAFSAIPGSINIPLENLRDSSLHFDKETPIVLCSKTSSRAYEAYRYLSVRGYNNIFVLEGGYIYFKKG